MAPTSPWGRHQQQWPPTGTPEKKVEVKPEESKKLTETEAFDLIKAEQVDLLKKLGVSDLEIKSLYNERKRVDKIMEVQ